jgi:RNA polymerase sigma-70 factor, ECF subfamily
MSALQQTHGDAAAGAGDELLEPLRRGDPIAWERLMRRNNRRLFRVARSMLRSDADAQDALQDAYLGAFRAIAGFRAEASLATWLNRIVVNECMTRLRKQARRDNVVPIVALDDEYDAQWDAQEDAAVHEPPSRIDRATPDDALQRAQLRMLIERKIDELPQEFRSVFVMRALEEMSVEEVAELMQVPAATVRSRFFRARSRLRESLARDIDFAMDDAFAFDGERCDRIVARVLQAMAAAPPHA